MHQKERAEKTPGEKQQHAHKLGGEGKEKSVVVAVHYGANCCCLNSRWERVEFVAVLRELGTDLNNFDILQCSCKFAVKVWILTCGLYALVASQSEHPVCPLLEALSNQLTEFVDI